MLESRKFTCGPGAGELSRVKLCFLLLPGLGCLERRVAKPDGGQGNRQEWHPYEDDLQKQSPISASTSAFHPDPDELSFAYA